CNLICDNEPHGAKASSRNRCKALLDQAGRAHYGHLSAVFMGSGSQRCVL
ncbi:uncharacterized, partial [Tachysurus ichikawai]